MPLTIAKTTVASTQLFIFLPKEYTSGVAKSRPDQHEFLEPEEWQSVNALLMLNRIVQTGLDTELRQAHGLAVTEFDVLITLFNAPDSRLRMTALADRVLLSPAGLTHLVTRLERDGLVRREVDPNDGRKWFAVLTDNGDATLRTARHTHNAVLRKTFLANTSPTERRSLQRIWSRLAPKA
jgi:DNA-binding MarR family transcriptional regulator